MSYVVLLLPLMERMVLVWFAAYLFSQTNLFWNIVRSRSTLKDHLLFVIIFSAIAILGTHLGIMIDDGAIANIRPLGAIVAGLIGGPYLGALVGLVAGAHRWYLGGITGFACGVATVVEGLTGGVIGQRFKHNFLDLRLALLAGIVGEIFQILFVLLLTKPFEKALAIEMSVGIPMIVVNTIGVVGFVVVIREVFKKHNGLIISQFNRFVDIERQISHAVQKNFNQEVTEALLKKMSAYTELRGILLCEGRRMIGFNGIESEMAAVLSAVNIDALSQGQKIKIKSGRASIHFYCVALKNKINEQPIWLGVKLMSKPYYDPYLIQFTNGLAELTDNQVAQNSARKLHEKMAVAQLKALKAQIQPHFLFNALSTIASLCRTDAAKARELIIDLANFFRKTIDEDADFVSIESELEGIESYLRIEKARLGERLSVVYDIDEGLLQEKIPTFFVQPLVENAIKHGISQLSEAGEVKLSIRRREAAIEIEITNSKCESYSSCSGCGHALKNIQSRLSHLYGEKAHFTLNLEDVKQTKATLCLPMEESHAQN